MSVSTPAIAAAAGAVLAFAALAAGSFFATGSQGSIAAGGTAGAGARVLVVEMRDFAFTPERLAAGIGDTIVWLNRDVAPHTATATDSTWSSARLEAGERWTWVVTAAGEHEYLCAYHPSMRGTIAVE